LTIRIAHLSDIHFGGEEPAAVKAAIDSVAAFAPNLTVVTGDLTLNGLPREFRAARAWLERLPKPLIVTPGNHDTPYWNLVLRALTPFDRYRTFIGAPDLVGFDGPELAARCLNSARGAQPRLNWSKGAIALQPLRRIDWGPASTLKVFGCHHPLIDIAGEPVTGGVHRGEAAAAILAAAGVDLILTGHVHVPFALALPGATSPCYALGAGTLSIRTRGGAPPSFSTIVAQRERFEVTALGWTGRGFDVLKDWRLPRRGAPPAIKQLPGLGDMANDQAAPPDLSPL
jgi:3',5'-cyclic AMP phosphodiesterase CpdA